MKCYKCQTELGEGFAVCPVCGTAFAPSGPAANKILEILRDKLFLTLCILLSVSFGATVLSGSGIPITSLLFVIFLWIVYSKAKKGVVDVANMRNVSGVVYAEYIIMNVSAILLIVCGVLFGFLFSFVSESAEATDAMMQGIKIGLAAAEIPFEITQTLAVVIGWVLAVFFAVVGVITLLVSIFAWRKLHRFVKSVYTGVQNGGQTPVVNVKTAKNWLWVFGIINALSALSSLLSFNIFTIAATGCAAAAFIVGAQLIEKHFIAKPAQPEYEQTETTW